MASAAAWLWLGGAPGWLVQGTVPARVAPHESEPLDVPSPSEGSLSGRERCRSRDGSTRRWSRSTRSATATLVAAGPAHARRHPAPAAHRRRSSAVPGSRARARRTPMRCPKCRYIGFEDNDQCRNCGYDFSLTRTERRSTCRSGRASPSDRWRTCDWRPPPDVRGRADAAAGCPEPLASPEPRPSPVQSGAKCGCVAGRPGRRRAARQREYATTTSACRAACPASADRADCRGAPADRAACSRRAVAGFCRLGRGGS